MLLFASVSDAHAAPSNDACTSPTAIAALPFNDTVDVTTATPAASDPTHSCSVGQNAHSVWYSLTAASSGALTANTAGSAFDTVLTAYSGGCATPVEVACNDDTSGTTQSKITFAVTAGATYLIEVTSFDAAAVGSLHLEVAVAEPPNGDDCGAAEVIASTPFQVTRDTTEATTADSDPASTFCGSGKNSASVWFQLTPPSNGMITARTFESDYDTVVTAYTGTCGAMTEAACNDDDEEQAPQSSLSFAAAGGTAYLLEVSAYGTKAGGMLHLAVTFVPSFTDLGGLGDVAAAKAANKCQKAVASAGGAFVAKKLGALDKCVGGLVKCVETQDGAKEDACLAKRGDTCAKQLAALPSAKQKLTDTLLGKCTLADLPFETGIRGVFGLAFSRLDGDCGASLHSVRDIATCLGTQLGCRAEDVFAVDQPRARELIGLPKANVPPSALTALDGCLPDYQGNGAGVADPVVGKAVDACAKTIRQAGSKFVRAKLKGLAKCAVSVFACIQTKPSDPACVSEKAKSACAKEFQKAQAESGKRIASIEKKCAETSIPYAVLRQAEAIRIAVLATDCADLGVPNIDTLANYEQCLVRRHTCAAEDAFRFQVPRADRLIAAVNLAPPAQYPSSFCPAPSP